MKLRECHPWGASSFETGGVYQLGGAAGKDQGDPRWEWRPHTSKKLAKYMSRWTREEEVALGSEEGEGNGSEERMERGGQKGKDTCHVPESLNIFLPHTPTLLSLTPQFRGPHSRLPHLCCQS